MKQAKILIIAGSDSSGGAGIQADIKTATAHKVFSSTVITALTAQSTQKVHAIHDVPIDFLRKQIDVVLEDIQFDAIKIGMLSSVEIIDCVALALKSKFKKIPLILDPVMVATSGDILLQKNAIENLKKKLISKSFIVTPNIDEAQILSGMKVRNLSEMRDAASHIKSLGCEAVLIKGGHLSFADGKIHSLLLDYDDEFHIISNKKIGTKNIHGTGCTLASAIASNIAKKIDLVSAVKKANNYVYRCASSNIKAGKGSLVLKHW
jgi:hydroxymethylpyrimidine/phosphomethylpyrimidine kinase